MGKEFEYCSSERFHSEEIFNEDIEISNDKNTLNFTVTSWGDRLGATLDKQQIAQLIAHLQAWLHTGSLAIAEPLQDATAFHDFPGRPFGGLIPANCPVCGSLVWKKDQKNESVPEGVKIEAEPTMTWKVEEKIVGLGAAKCPVCGLNRMVGHYTNDELQSRYCMYCGHQDTKP